MRLAASTTPGHAFLSFVCSLSSAPVTAAPMRQPPFSSVIVRVSEIFLMSTMSSGSRMSVRIWTRRSVPPASTRASPRAPASRATAPSTESGASYRMSAGSPFLVCRYAAATADYNLAPGRLLNPATSRQIPSCVDVRALEVHLVGARDLHGVARGASRTRARRSCQTPQEASTSPPFLDGAAHDTLVSAGHAMDLLELRVIERVVAVVIGSLSTVLALSPLPAHAQAADAAAALVSHSPCPSNASPTLLPVQTLKDALQAWSKALHIP